MRKATAAVIVAGLAVVVTVYVAGALPGGLVDSVPGAYEAGIGLGLGLSLLGALVAGFAAAAIVVRAINEAALMAMARRNTAQ